MLPTVPARWSALECPPSSADIPFAMTRPRLRRSSAAVLAAFAFAGLAGCAVGPDYVRPTVEVPAAYKEAGPWKTAEPRAVDSAQPWWEWYGDETMNGLVVAANAANQNIRQAEAQYRQAKAVLDADRAGFYPNVNGGVSAGRGVSATTGRDVTAYGVNLSASWVPDLWGAVRRSVESGEAGVAASADDLAAARLSIQVAVAQAYLQLRYIDVQRELYANTVAAYTRALNLTQAQFGAGVALRSDVALAQTQLKTAQAQGVDLDAQRSQLEHAIAILTGRPPAAFALAAVDAGRQVPGTHARDSRHPAVRAARKPPRYRRRRAPCRAGQRQHRRRQGGLLPAAQPRRVRRPLGRHVRAPLRHPQPRLVARRDTGAVALRRGPAASAYRPGDCRLRHRRRPIQAGRC